MLISQTKPEPIKNVRTNKTFLARFSNTNNNNNNRSFENVNKNGNFESPVTMKCLNELPKTKVINNKKSHSEVSPPLISKNTTEIPSQNEDISIISHHSSISSKDEEVVNFKKYIGPNEEIRTEDQTSKIFTDKESNLDILTIYGNEEANGNNDDFKKVSSYYQETQVFYILFKSKLNNLIKFFFKAKSRRFFTTRVYF